MINLPLLNSLRWTKGWRDLSHNRLRSFLIILSIGVGVTAFGMIIGAGRIVRQNLSEQFLTIQPASATLLSDSFDADFVESVAELPDVAFAEGRRSLPVRMQLANGDWQEMQIVTLDSFDEQSVDIIRPFSGSYPPPDRTLLVERNSLFLLQAALGDVITVQLPNGRLRQMPIVGLTHDLKQLPAQVFGVGFAYVTDETLEWLEAPAGFNQLKIRVAGDTQDVAHIEAVVADVEEKLEKSGRRVLSSDIPTPDVHPADDLLDTVLLILTILGFLALLLSGFLIINSLNAILQQQIRHIGIMKAFGARPRHIVGLYVRFVLLLGLLSLVISLPLSSLGAYVLARFIGSQVNFDIVQFRPEPQTLLLQTAVSLLIPLAAALLPMRRAAQISIRAALEESQISAQGGRALLERLLGWLKMSRPLRLSLRNTFRRKGRLALTLFTLLLSGAIFMSVMSLRTSMFATLDALLASSGYDVQVQFGRSYRTAALEQAVHHTPNVTAVESWYIERGLPVRPSGQEGEPLIVHAVPHDTQLFTPVLGAGRWLGAEEGQSIVLHSNVLVNEPYLQLGSELTLNINGEESTWRIVGVTQELLPPVGPANVYVSYEAFTRELGGAGRANTIQVVTSAHDPLTHATALREIETRLETADFLTASSQTATDERNTLTERFNIMTVVLTIMSFLIAVVGSLGLMGTMSINVLERRREIGVMRAIGARDGAVRQIFTVEGVLIGLLSWGGALVLAQPMSRVMSWQIGLQLLRLPLVYRFSFMGAGIWLLLIVTLAYGASYWPAQQAANLKIREILAYE